MCRGCAFLLRNGIPCVGVQPVIHSPLGDSGLVSSLRLLEIQLLGYPRTGFCVNLFSFLLLKYPGLGLYGEGTLRFIRNGHTVFQWLHSLYLHQPCTGDPASPHPRQHWVASVFFISVMLVCRGLPLMSPVKTARQYGAFRAWAGCLQTSHRSSFPYSCRHSSLGYLAFP